MHRDLLRRRFWVEAAAAGLTALFSVLTLLWKDWIEIVFRVDPDHHSGSLEWLIVGVCLAVAVGLSILARIEYQRATSAPA